MFLKKHLFPMMDTGARRLAGGNERGAGCLF